MIINDTSIVIRMTIISDSPSCGITFNHQSANTSRGVIYCPREFIVQASLMMIVIYNRHFL